MNKLLALLFNILCCYAKLKPCPTEWTLVNTPGAFNVASKNDQIWIESTEQFPETPGHYRLFSLKDGLWVAENSQKKGAKLHTLKVDSKGNPAYVGADRKIHWK